MKKVYFVRHGETEWNRLCKIQGQADIPLNERGRYEAGLAASFFRCQSIRRELPVAGPVGNRKIDRCY